MLTRVLIWGLLAFLILRALYRLLGGIIEGGSSRPQPNASSPGKGEMMARDPVCGTFVVPSKALSHRDRQGTHYFCSEKCRKAFVEASR